MVTPKRNRRISSLFLCVLCAVCCVLAAAVHADVSHLIRYQGELVDNTGQPLAAPTANLIFSLYAAATGGTPVWTETQPNAPLTAGRFSVLLGSVTSLSSVDWSVPLWLGITVNTDPEMTPRQQITSVPTAIMAERLSGVITTVGSSVGIGLGTTNPGATLDIAGNVKIADGTQGGGKVLTSDVSGLASWQTLPPGVPSGAIILWTGSTCPAGYTRFSALDGKFLVADATYNQVAGGSNTKDLTHSHGAGGYTLPSHSHTFATSGTSSAINMDPNIRVGVINGFLSGSQGSESGPSVQDHTQTDGGGGALSGTSAIGGQSSVDIRPAFATILLCQKD